MLNFASQNMGRGVGPGLQGTLDLLVIQMCKYGVIVNAFGPYTWA